MKTTHLSKQAIRRSIVLIVLFLAILFVNKTIAQLNTGNNTANSSAVPEVRINAYSLKQFI